MIGSTCCWVVISQLATHRLLSQFPLQQYEGPRGSAQFAPTGALPDAYSVHILYSQFPLQHDDGLLHVQPKVKLVLGDETSDGEETTGEVSSVAGDGDGEPWVLPYVGYGIVWSVRHGEQISYGSWSILSWPTSCLAIVRRWLVVYP